MSTPNPRPGYRIAYTEEAADARNELPDDRREHLKELTDRLAADPYGTASAAVASNPQFRQALHAHLCVTYQIVGEILLVVVLAVFAA